MCMLPHRACIRYLGQAAPLLNQLPGRAFTDVTPLVTRRRSRRAVVQAAETGMGVESISVFVISPGRVNIMKIRLAAACAWSIVLAVAATLMPWPSLGATPTEVATTKQSSASGTRAPPGVPGRESHPSKPAGNQRAGKDSNPSATNASGLSDRDLAKRIVPRCRARPELCVKQRDKAQVEPPNPASDKGPTE
jgi:hypothetical protein